MVHPCTCIVVYGVLWMCIPIIIHSSVTVTNCVCIVECYCIMVSCRSGVQLISMAFVVMVQMPTGCSSRVDSPVAKCEGRHKSRKHLPSNGRFLLEDNDQGMSAFQWELQIVDNNPYLSEE